MGKIYTQLSIEERTMIQTQLSMGCKPGQIALELGRSPGTLSRELTRNGWTRPQLPRRVGRPMLSGGYRADAAQSRANAGTVGPRVARKLQPGTALWKQVTKYLKIGYSPEQIAGTLATVHGAGQNGRCQCRFCGGGLRSCAQPNRGAKTPVDDL